MTGYAGTGKTWVDLPSNATPVMAADLTTMEAGIASAWAAGNRIDNLAEFNGVYGTGVTSFDQEFEAAAGTTSLPSGWSWVNQGSITYAEQFGAGAMTIPTNGNTDTWRGAFQSLSGAASAWTAIAKVEGAGSQAGGAWHYGLILRDSASGKLLPFNYWFGFKLELVRWTNPTTPEGGWYVAHGDAVAWPSMPAHYFMIKKNSSSSWDFKFSTDGITWFAVASAIDISGFITPNQIGFGTNPANSACQVACHWFRLR